MGPPPPAPLPDDLVEEILLRIPPSDPATLMRAAVAQKRWWRLVAGRGFRRRYRNLHRTPPALGFFCDPRDGDGFSTSFVPASSFRPKPRGANADHREYRPEDAHHGVLLRLHRTSSGVVIPQFGLVVWDTITGHRVLLPKVPRPNGFYDKWNYKATVFCSDLCHRCDHLDCHRGCFTVVLIGHYPRGLFSCVYSSDSEMWNSMLFARHHTAFHRGGLGLGEYGETSRARVEDALYCMLDKQNKILKFGLHSWEFSVIEPPPLLSSEEFIRSERIQLATMEDGQLGLAVLRKCTLHILSRDKKFGWRENKTIDLEKCDNYVPSTVPPFLIGFAGDIGLVFMNAGNNGILSVDIRSAQVKVFYKRACISRIVAYTNFVTPAVDTGGQRISPVDSHRARRRGVAFIPPRRQLGHSYPRQGNK